MMKKSMYIITICLKDRDEDGEEINWSNPTEEYYANTKEEAIEMKRKFLSGEDKFYGSLIEDCIISDEKEEREFL